MMANPFSSNYDSVNDDAEDCENESGSNSSSDSLFDNVGSVAKHHEAVGGSLEDTDNNSSDDDESADDSSVDSAGSALLHMAQMSNPNASSQEMFPEDFVSTDVCGCCFQCNASNSVKHLNKPIIKDGLRRFLADCFIFQRTSDDDYLLSGTTLQNKNSKIPRQRKQNNE